MTTTEESGHWPGPSFEVIKSEDGQRIFDGEPYWWIRNNESINEGKAYLGMIFNPPPNHRRYSTKEAAEQDLNPTKPFVSNYVAASQPRVVCAAGVNLTFVPTKDTASGKSIAIFSNGTYLTTLNASERAELKVLLQDLV